ncbi:hypothetical protein BDR22DRAFT_872831 [Usnea florida]
MLWNSLFFFLKVEGWAFGIGGLGLNSVFSLFFIVPVRGILRCGCTVVSPASFYAIWCQKPRPLSPGPHDPVDPLHSSIGRPCFTSVVVVV